MVACVNIVDGVTSIYRWDGNTESNTESILIAKTTAAKRKNAMARMQALHSYDTPCIVSYDISDGVPEYLDWVMHEREDLRAKVGLTKQGAARNGENSPH